MKGNVQKGTMILTLWGGEGQSVPIGFRLAATSHRIMQWLQKFLTLSKFSKIRVLKIHYFHLLRKKIPQIEIWPVPVRQSRAAFEPNDVLLTNLMTSHASILFLSLFLPWIQTSYNGAYTGTIFVSFFWNQTTHIAILPTIKYFQASIQLQILYWHTWSSPNENPLIKAFNSMRSQNIFLLYNKRSASKSKQMKWKWQQ